MFINRYRSVVTEGAWAAGGQVIYSLGLLAGIKAITSMVPPSVYGLLALYIALLNLCSGIFARPFIHAGLRFYHDAAGKDEFARLRAVLGGLLQRSSAVVVLLIFSGGLIYVQISRRAGFSLPFLLAALLIADIWRSYESSLLNAARNQRRFALWLAVEGWFRPAGAVVAIHYWEPSAEAILAGYTAGAFLALAVFNRPSAVEPPALAGRLKEDRESLRNKVVEYAKPLFGLALVGWISSTGDRYLLAGMMGMQEVGIYAAAYGLIIRPFMLVETVVELTVRPLYFQAVACGQSEREKRILAIWLGLAGSVCLIGIVMVFFLKDWITSVFLGAGFEQSSQLMPYIAAGASLAAMSHVLEKPFYAHLQTRPVLVIQSLVAAFGLFTTFVCIRWWGLPGAARAVPIYYGFQCGLTILYAKMGIKSSRRK